MTNRELQAIRVRWSGDLNGSYDYDDVRALLAEVDRLRELENAWDAAWAVAQSQIATLKAEVERAIAERDAARAVLQSHRYTMREGTLVCVECREDECKPDCSLAAALGGGK